MVSDNTKKTFMFVIPVVLILLLSVVTPGLIRAEDVNIEENDYTARDPIRIDGNDDFASQAADEGWPGDGSEGDPYVIEGYGIDGTGYGYGIYIGNTTVHFVVRGCYVHNVSGKDGTALQNSGFYLQNVRNGGFENNVLYNKWGFKLWESDNNIIDNNTIYVIRRGCGIQVHRSDNNLMFGNNIDYLDTESGWGGIVLFESEYNTIIDNHISGFKSGIQFVDCYEYEVNNNTFSDCVWEINFLYSVSNGDGILPLILIVPLAIAILLVCVISLVIWKKKNQKRS